MKNYIVISVGAEKASDKTQHLYDKNTQLTRETLELPQYYKDHIWPNAPMTLSGERLKAFPQDKEKVKDARFHHFCSTEYWKSQPKQLAKKKKF